MKLPAPLSAWVTLHLSPRFRRRMGTRRELARRYLSGRGVEIGGLIMPVPLPPGASAWYVDAWTTPRLRDRYPQYRWVKMVAVDVVADGQTLDAVADASLDFVIANHLIEHCGDPLTAVESWLGKLKRDGILYMAVPDARRTFDRGRPLTTAEHLLRDYEEGPEGSERQHWEEFATHVLGASPGEAAAVIAEHRARDHRPHYHVWTPASFRETLDAARSLAFPFQLEEITSVGIEFIVILRRT